MLRKGLAMALLSELMRWAVVQAIPQNPDQLAHKAQGLVVQLAGLFVAAVTLMLGAAVLVTALVLMALPAPLPPEGILLAVGALSMVLGGGAWLAFANFKKLGRTMTETFHAPDRPVDVVARKANHIARAFMEGWEKGNGTPSRW